MPYYDYLCKTCGAACRAWRQEGQPPIYCDRKCRAADPAPRLTSQARWTVTPLMSEQIRRVYETRTGGGEVKDLARRLAMPYWKVRRHAQEQGWLAKACKESNWTEVELNILERSAHRSMDTIQRRLARAGFKRTVSAIALKRKRLKLAKNLPGHSAAGLALCFGVTDATVADWIEKGLLRADRRGAARHGAPFFIRDAWVRDFILTYPQRVDLRKVDKFWFIDLLASPRGSAAWGPAGTAESEGFEGEVEAGSY